MNPITLCAHHICISARLLYDTPSCCPLEHVCTSTWERSFWLATSFVPRWENKNAFDLPTTPHFSHNFFLELCLPFIDLILLLVLFWIWTLYIYFYMCIIASQWLENSIYLRAHTTYEVILVSSAGWVPRFLQKATAQGAGNAKLNPERGQPSSWECLSIQ